MMTAEEFKSLEPYFGKWYIEDKAAEGKNSVVYRAFCMENGEKQYKAIRVIKFPGSNEEISRALDSEQFATVNEYLDYAEKTVCENIERIYSFKNSKNIVKFEDYKVIKESSCFYVLILTELLTPLSDYIRQKRIRHKDAVKIGWDICTALEEFRLAGITHPNIKPENIYFDGKSDYKLGDFGIDGKYRTKSGMSTYNAPEKGTEQEIISSDIYSLGMVLYRVLNNNRAPFLPAYPAPISFEDREIAATRRLRGDMFPAPANADSKLAHIIFTATAFRPEDRYDSPADMKNALEEYVKKVLVAGSTAEKNPAPVNYVPVRQPSQKRKDGADSVTDRDKAAFAEAFRDDEQDDLPEKKDYKKWYILIGALSVALVVLIVIFVNLLKGNDDDIVYNPDYGQTTTEQVTTEPETTEEETTEEETTEEETTEEETTEEETTEAETTEEETTEAETTEEETTEEETTEQATTEAKAQAGTTDNSGRVYFDITDYYVIYTPQSEGDTEIVVELNNLPDGNPIQGGKAYICTVASGTIIDKSEINMSIVPGDQQSYLCYFEITDEFFIYSPDEFDYYIELSAGAVETSSAVSTETKIEL